MDVDKRSSLSTGNVSRRDEFTDHRGRGADSLDGPMWRGPGLKITCCRSFLGRPYPMTTHWGTQHIQIRLPPVLETRRPRSQCPRAELPAEAPGEGPSCLFQLLGAPGVSPWAGGRLPPVSASVSTWLLLCVRVSRLLCLIRTLSLGLGPPPSRRTSSQTLHSITAAET